MAISPITVDEARHLYAAAATIVGPAADGPEAWAANVTRVVEELDRLAGEFVARRTVIAEATPFTGRVLRVETVERGEGRKGRIVFAPTSGDAAGTGKEEDITTGWLDDPNAAAVLARAQELIGAEVVFYKVMESNEESGGRKYRCLVGIEPKRTTAEQAPAPAPAPAPAAAPAPALAQKSGAAKRQPSGGGSAPATPTPTPEAPQPSLPLAPTTPGELLTMAREIGVTPEVVKQTMAQMFGQLAPGAVRSAAEVAACWERISGAARAA
ncbi:MAG TPA: hypothetical protein VHD87_12780 [Acidimicrobiales bacterium]|nr:hypothetical protein [Acidimicrobiales bacterium]